MPKIATTFFTEPKEGKQYIITEAKEATVKIEEQETQTIRVVLKSTNEQDKTVYSTSLWLSDSASATSKLGSFVEAFALFFKGVKDAYETDNWLNHTVEIVSWKERQREIEVIKAPIS